MRKQHRTVSEIDADITAWYHARNAERLGMNRERVKAYDRKRKELEEERVDAAVNERIGSPKEGKS